MRNTLRSFLRDGVGRKRDEGARWRLGKRGDRINAMFCSGTRDGKERYY